MSYDLTSNSVPVNPDTEVDLYGRPSMGGSAPHPQNPKKPYRPLSGVEALAALDRYLGVDPDDPDDPHDADAPKTRDTPLAPFPAMPGRIVVAPALAAPNSLSTVTAGSGPGRAPVSPRLQRLHAYRPRFLSVTVFRELQSAAVDLVSKVPFVSEESDDAMCSHLYGLAGFAHADSGQFDPDEHLRDRWIQLYCSQIAATLTPNTVATARSSLRRIRAGSTPIVTKGSRVPVLEPYNPREWSTWRRRTDVLIDLGLKKQMTMLLDLTGEAGLRSREVSQAEGSWVRAHNGQVYLVVPDRNGVARNVPVFGAAATRLRAAQDLPGLLFMPQMAKRSNAISKLAEQVGTVSKGLGGFRAGRARHQWISRLLEEAIPFTTVCYVSGINAGSHTPTDLLKYLPTPEPEAVAKQMEHARKRGWGEGL